MIKDGINVQILHPPGGPCLRESRSFVFLTSQHLFPSSLKGLKLLRSHARNQASPLLTYDVSLRAICCTPPPALQHPNVYCTECRSFTLSLTLVLAPRLCRSLTTSRWPPRQAQCMAVQSSWKGWVGLNSRAVGKEVSWGKD